MDLWVVNDTIGRSGCGMFRTLPRFEGPGSGAFWPLGRGAGPRRPRLREWNRVEGVAG